MLVSLVLSCLISNTLAYWWDDNAKMSGNLNAFQQDYSLQNSFNQDFAAFAGDYDDNQEEDAYEDYADDEEFQQELDAAYAKGYAYAQRSRENSAAFANFDDELEAAYAAFASEYGTYEDEEEDDDYYDDADEEFQQELDAAYAKGYAYAQRAQENSAAFANFDDQLEAAYQYFANEYASQGAYDDEYYGDYDDADQFDDDDFQEQLDAAYAQGFAFGQRSDANPAAAAAAAAAFAEDFAADQYFYEEENDEYYYDEDYEEEEEDFAQMEQNLNEFEKGYRGGYSAALSELKSRLLRLAQ